MESRILERRRVLQLVALGALAAPAIALAGCVAGGGRTQPRRYGGGGSDKPGKNGGFGGKGSGGD